MKPVVLGFADRPLLTEPDGVFVDGVWREVVPAVRLSDSFSRLTGLLRSTDDR
jgi:hypothetical protein